MRATAGLPSLVFGFFERVTPMASTPPLGRRHGAEVADPEAEPAPLAELRVDVVGLALLAADGPLRARAGAEAAARAQVRVDGVGQQVQTLARRAAMLQHVGPVLV